MQGNAKKTAKVPPHVGEIDGAPVVGRYYMVPAIWQARHPPGLTDYGAMWWPITGPLHNDQQFFEFKHDHYHVDIRFLGTRHIRRMGYTGWLAESPLEAELARPVHAFVGGPPLPKPELRKMRCRRLSVTYPYATSKQVRAVNDHFKGCSALANAKGHRYCPHQKARIDQIPPDADGIVTCPLHGLRFDSDWNVVT